MAREMKDSGIEWIGEIPREWKTSRIKYVANIFGRIGFRGYTTDDLVDEGNGAITLSPSNISNMKTTYEKCSYVSWKKYNESPEIAINNNDVIFVKTGSSYGKSAIVENLPMEATINPQLVVFKDIKYDNKFFMYILQTQYIKYQVEQIVSGGTIPTMAQEKIKNFIIVLPPLAEQQKIADFLDSECAKIDDVISKTKATVEEYKKLKHSVITKAVTKGIRPNREMKDSGIEWIGEIPREWETAEMKMFCKVNNGKEIINEVDKNETGAIPVYGSGGIFKYTNERMYNGVSVMFGRKGTLGKPLYVNGEFWVVDTMYYLTSFNLLKPKFNFYQLCAFDWNPFITQTALPSIVASQIIAQKFAFPPLAEQQEIADYLDKKCAEIDTLITKKEQLIAELESYKKSLIYEYVTGKKEVK